MAPRTGAHRERTQGHGASPGLKEHLRNHDIEREAREAEPRSEEEARQMEEAEKVAKARAQGTGDSQASGGMGNNPA